MEAGAAVARRIIDRGGASTLWILPSSFLRQIDLELFGSAASDARAGGGHAAGGAAVVLQLAMWRLPFSLGYQVARRATDDHALAQIISFNVD